MTLSVPGVGSGGGGKVVGGLSDLLTGLVYWYGCGVTRVVTMKASTQSCHQRGHAAMSSSTTTALSRQLLAQVL